jgi:hypothetical protein
MRSAEWTRLIQLHRAVGFFKVRINGFLDEWIDGNGLALNYFGPAKNIFKKMAKIPPRELQDAPLVIKWRDERRVACCGLLGSERGNRPKFQASIRLCASLRRDKSSNRPEKFREPSSHLGNNSGAETGAPIESAGGTPVLPGRVPVQPRQTWSNQVQPSPTKNPSGSHRITPDHSAQGRAASLRSVAPRGRGPAGGIHLPDATTPQAPALPGRVPVQPRRIASGWVKPSQGQSKVQYPKAFECEMKFQPSGETPGTNFQ